MLLIPQRQREQIIRLLNKIGMEEKLIKAIANIYMENLCNIHYPAQ